jgi:hypothetical protein
LKFEFHELGDFRIWWNLACGTLITPSCQLKVYPRICGSQGKVFGLTSRFNLNFFKSRFTLLQYGLST